MSWSKWNFKAYCQCTINVAVIIVVIVIVVFAFVVIVLGEESGGFVVTSYGLHLAEWV
jgi:hypothetical protein